jgi:phage terminase large subunit-like protein
VGRVNLTNRACVFGAWLSEFIDEATSFPHGPHDDQIDAVSGAFQMISKPEDEWIMY